MIIELLVISPLIIFFILFVFKTASIKNFTVYAQGTYDNENIRVMFRSWGGFGSFRMYSVSRYFLTKDFHFDYDRLRWSEDYVWKFFAKKEYKNLINIYKLKELGNYS